MIYCFSGSTSFKEQTTGLLQRRVPYEIPQKEQSIKEMAFPGHDHRSQQDKGHVL